MMLTEQIYAQALLLAGDVGDEKKELLRTFCNAAEVSLKARIREPLTPEDCKADFIAASSLYALAALSEADKLGDMEQFSLGDVTVRKRNTDAAVNCLRSQAELLMSPFLKDWFSFGGV